MRNTDNKMACGAVDVVLAVVVILFLFRFCSLCCQTPNINTANNEHANENNEKEMAETIMRGQTDPAEARLRRLHSLKGLKRVEPSRRTCINAGAVARDVCVWGGGEPSISLLSAPT